MHGSAASSGRSAVCPRFGERSTTTIAAEKRLIDGAIAGFNRDLALLLTIFALLMVGSATLQVAFGLRPLRGIAGEIDRLRQGRISRLGGDVPAEFSALVARLNALLDAQAAFVGRARAKAGASRTACEPRSR